VKKKLNEVKLAARVKTALRVINDKLGIQKDEANSTGFGIDGFEMTNAMKDYIDDLSPDEKKVLVDVIKSITLLTSGNVASVRSSGRTFDPAASEPWTEILSDISMDLLNYMKFDVSQKITKRDYVVAKKMLSSLSSQRNVVADPMKKYTKMYRGMAKLSKNTLTFLLSTDRLVIPAESSFSTDMKEAWKFATGGQYNTFFVISNPDMKGIDARGLSKFSHEDEIIFSGEIRIDKIGINNNRSKKQDPSDISQSNFILDPKESLFGGGQKSMILDAMPDDEDGDWFWDGTKLPNGKRLHRPLFIFHGTVI
jgi:hypothetical protein